MTEYENLQEKLEHLEAQVDKLTRSVESLLGLWEQAKGGVTFVKWSASIVGTLSALFFFLKDHIK